MPVASAARSSSVPTIRWTPRSSVHLHRSRAVKIASSSVRRPPRRRSPSDRSGPVDRTRDPPRKHLSLSTPRNWRRPRVDILRGSSPSPLSPSPSAPGWPTPSPPPPAPRATSVSVSSAVFCAPCARAAVPGCPRRGRGIPSWPSRSSVGPSPRRSAGSSTAIAPTSRRRWVTSLAGPRVRRAERRCGRSRAPPPRAARGAGVQPGGAPRRPCREGAGRAPRGAGSRPDAPHGTAGAARPGEPARQRGRSLPRPAPEECEAGAWCWSTTLPPPARRWPRAERAAGGGGRVGDGPGGGARGARPCGEPQRCGKPRLWRRCELHPRRGLKSPATQGKSLRDCRTASPSAVPRDFTCVARGFNPGRGYSRARTFQLATADGGPHA